MLLAAVMVLALLGSHASAAALADYLRGPQISDVVLSDDGKRLAYVAQLGEARHVIAQTIDERQALADIDLGVQKIWGIQWAGSDFLLIYTTQDGKLAPNAWLEQLYVRAFNLKTRQLVDVLKDTPNAFNSVRGYAAIREEGGATKAVLLGGYQTPVMAIGSPATFEADLTTGKTVVSEVESVYNEDVQLAPNGSAALVNWTDRPARYLLQTKQDSKWRTVLERAYAPRLLGINAEGGPVLLLREEPDAGVHSVGADGRVTRLLGSDGFEGVIRGASNRQVFALVTQNDSVLSYQFLDKTDQVRWQAITKAYPGQTVNWVSSSGDRKRIVVLVSGGGETPHFALVDLTTGKSRLLGEPYPTLKAADIATQTKITFTADDGLKFVGKLTRPNTTARNLPLIVIAPGDSVGWSFGDFSASAQAFAAVGYAVFEPDHRGTDDPGGGGIYSDKALSEMAAGVRALIKQGTADPKRICIIGSGSLGGYSAVAAMAREPELYRCAVAMNGGLFDVREMIADSRSDRTTKQALRYFGVQNMDELQKVSLTRNAASVKGPVLLVQPSRMKTTYAEQARALGKAIQRTKGTAYVVDEEGDSESLAAPAAVVKTFETVLNFIRNTNPPN